MLAKTSLQSYRPGMTPPEDAVRVSDPAVLRALAHPLRARLLGLLRFDGPSTATRLAERVHESSGVTSYHLRQLEAHGFVAEVEGRGTGRERWWQARHLMTSWQPDELLDQPGGAEATDQMHRLQVEGWGASCGPGSRAARGTAASGRASSGLSDHGMHLTPAEARTLLGELYAVLARWGADHREPGEGAALVTVLTGLFPRTEERS